MFGRQCDVQSLIITVDKYIIYETIFIEFIYLRKNEIVTKPFTIIEVPCKVS